MGVAVQDAAAAGLVLRGAQRHGVGTVLALEEMTAAGSCSGERGRVASYPPAIRRALPNSEHRRHKGLNNRAENSHLPTRKRERILQRFKSAEHAQRFLVPFSAVSNHFRPRRHRLTASSYRQFRTQAHTAWLDVTLAGVCH